jgi:hypothetical protein
MSKAISESNKLVTGAQDYEFLQSLSEDQRKKAEKARSAQEQVHLPTE